MEILKNVATICSLIGGFCGFILVVVRITEYLKTRRVKRLANKSEKAKAEKIKDELYKVYLENEKKVK